MNSLASAWPLGAVIVAALIAYLAGRSAGARLEREHRAAAERKARDIADQVDNDVGAMPPKDAREELRRWSR